MPACKNCKGVIIVQGGFIRANNVTNAKSAVCTLLRAMLEALKKSHPRKQCVCFFIRSAGRPTICSPKISTHGRHSSTGGSVEAGANIPEQETSGDIKEMGFDEMWHFVGAKKQVLDYQSLLTVAHGELWPGSSVVVILQHSNDSTTK